MPETQAHSVEYPATLELKDGSRFVGDLSALHDGGLKLVALRLIKRPHSGLEPALPQMIEHHGTCPYLPNRIGNALFCNIGR